MGFRIYSNRLPQWRMDGASYFVGWNLHSPLMELSADERTVVKKALLHFDTQRYELDAWVIMDDHAHALLHLQDGFELEEILHTWKSFTARELQRKFGRQGIVWQKDTFTRIVRNEKEWLEKQRYIMHNPYKRWPEITSYEWVWPVEA